tara:strand:+ start:17824 stop:18660 length:837 start_codon:yes stop_codon:yes gene_type:complete
MQTDSDVDEAEITLEDNETEQSQNIDETTEVDSQENDESDSSPNEEKVVFSEAQQRVLDKQIGKKVGKLREVERDNQTLRQRLQDVEAQLNKPVDVEVPPMPDAFSMTDAEYKEKVAQRDKAIVESALQKKAAEAQEEAAAKQRADRIAEAQQEAEAKRKVYENRAAELGVALPELQQAGQTLYNAGLHNEVAGYLLDADNGPLISQYLGQNPLELDNVLQKQNQSIADAIIYMHTEIRAKLQSLAKSNVNQAPDPIEKPAVSGKQKKQGGPQGATFE